eukprot:g7983.t1
MEQVEVLNRHVVDLPERVAGLPKELESGESPIPYDYDLSIEDPQYRIIENNIGELDVQVLAAVQSPPIAFLRRGTLGHNQQQKEAPSLTQKNDPEDAQTGCEGTAACCGEQLKLDPPSLLGGNKPVVGASGDDAVSVGHTVEGSSNFVGDIRRLRKAGGLHHHDDACFSISWSRTPRPGGVGNARARRDDAAVGGPAAPAGGRASPRRGVGADGRGGSRGVSEKGGPSAAFAPEAICTAGEVEPLALAKELGIQTIVDRITRAIVHVDKDRAPEARGGIRGRSAGRRADGPEGGRGRVRAVEAGLVMTVGNAEVSSGGSHDEDHACLRSARHTPPPANQWPQLVQFAGTDPPVVGRSFRSSPPPPGRHDHGVDRSRRPKEDIGRLRRVVRDTMSSMQWPPTSASSTSLYGGGAALVGGERCGTHPPQWSQKHEACLADMRRRLRETGSPLLRAKDPAVLLGALLRRQGRLIRLLDEAVLSLEDTAEALDALVLVSTRLKNAGVSADALFTRAGVVKPGAAGSLGHAAAAGVGAGGASGDGRSTKRPSGAEVSSKVRRCSIKRIHVEIHRVLGEAASFREFKIALSACVRSGDGGGGGGGRGGGGGGGGNGGESGMEWITVDQLDHALRTCHLTRRALDPQGASHPPLTGKRVTRFLEDMERSSSSKAQPPVTTGAVAAAATAAGTSQNAANMLLLGNEAHSQSPTGGGASKRGVPAKQQRQGRRAKMARKRTGRWNDDDRDLAERELAAVVVERQKKFVEGYVRERRRYLSRRVSAQREGHGGFQREKVPTGSNGRPSKKVTEAEKAEFSEAVARTKIVLKLLEIKAAAPSLPQPSGGCAGFPSSTGKSNPTDLEAKRGIGVARKTNHNADARRGRRRPASAETAPTTNNQTLSPKKKQDGVIRSAAAAGDGKTAKRNMKQVLRTSTEAYSDRVGQHGGGAARLHTSTNPRLGGGGAGAAGGASGGITAGGGGERGRMFAAAQTVQVAYRQRMFHRFVWAQAYLRSPVHAFGLFKRCLTVLRGADAATAAAAAAGAPTAAAAATAAAASGASAGAGIGAGAGGTPAGIPAAKTTSRASADDVASIDAWPELPGFCLSLPHHAHAADPVFLRYVRWRQREISNGGGSFDERINGATAVKPASGGSTAVVAPLPPPQPLAFAQNEGSPQQPQQHERPPEGNRLFEKRHPIRTATVRSMLIDLRVPFLPGALDSAMDDLERTIAREGGGGGGVNNAAVFGGGSNSRPGGDGRSDHDTAGSAVAAAGTSKEQTGNGVGGRAVARGCRLGQHGAAAEISFAGWFCWWVRHLPFDPASTGCLLKTVRCAKALHAAEISAGAGRL